MGELGEILETIMKKIQANTTKLVQAKVGELVNKFHEMVESGEGLTVEMDDLQGNCFVYCKDGNENVREEYYERTPA